MNPLESLSEYTGELQSSLMFPSFIFGDYNFGLTNFVFYMIIGFILLLFVVFFAKSRLSIVPKSKFANLIEYGYEFVRKDVCKGCIGSTYKRHIPFLATLFFFIFIANLIGLIPGAYASTGSISITWALSIISFCYFNYWGVKSLGGWNYIKSIAPSGLPKPMVPVIWFFEFISLCLRALTLAVRLFGNMFAGHMVLGIFAILTSVFTISAIQSLDFVIALPSIAWIFLLIAMYCLELLVAFLQAFIFTTLSAVYIAEAIEES